MKDGTAQVHSITRNAVLPAETYNRIIGENDCGTAIS